MRSTLRSPGLRRILVAYAANRLGTWFGLVALSLAVFDHTHSALAVAGLLLAWQAVPAFVVPAVIARVEASRRRSELSALYFFEAAVTAALAVLLWHFWLPGVLLLAALDGTAALAASALLRAAVARAARDEVERAPDATLTLESIEQQAQEAEHSANAALNIAFSATFVLGPLLAGTTVAAGGAPTALFIDVGSFVICGALLSNLHPDVHDAGSESVRARLRAAWRHITLTPSLRGLLLADAAALVFFGSAGPIEVAYAKATLHAGDRGYGLLLTVWGVGAIIGSLVFARSVRRPLAVMLSAGALAVGVAYLGFAAAPSLAVACIAALIGGVGNAVELPSMISIVQRLTRQELHGQLMGAVESLAALSLAIGLPMGGALVALGSPRLAFLVVGLGAIGTTAVILRISLNATALKRDAEVPGAPAPGLEPVVAGDAPSGEPRL